MTNSAADALSTSARQLIREAVGQYHEKYGFGSMSCAVYDTAWVSMVTKSTGNPNSKKIWLIPQAFTYLLRTQSEDGSWDSIGSPSRVDSILNIAASLLALKRHLDEPLQVQHTLSQDDLRQRIHRAVCALRARLGDWDISEANSVGFEIIIPSVLELLEHEGLIFNFEGKTELLGLRDAKLARFKPECLYSQKRMTALHSLEAFISMIDFDRVAHHCSGGSMMGSPSSTAAYLMYASHWDDDAENYLRHIACGDRGGGFPSAYPSTYFEYTWILSTFLRAGFSTSELACPELDKMRDILAEGFREDGETIGFAPGVGEDVDDTAKGIMCLARFSPGEQKALVDTMIEHFETKSHFQTYASERDPSFSANCNVLLSLLHQQEASRYEAQILKTVNFLCNYWWSAHDTPHDKWNLSYLYSSMLIGQAFTDLLASVDKGLIRLNDDLTSRVSITLVQCCLRVLLNQSENGSWNDSIEQTSYGVAVLSESIRLNCFKDLNRQLQKALDSAVGFLQTPGPPDYIWIEKVTYSSPFLTQCYKLAALKLFLNLSTHIEAEKHIVGSPVKLRHKYVDLFRQLPLFSSVPVWQLQASSIESSLFSPMLRAQRLSVFPRLDMEEDRYFDMIPYIWTACNNYSKAFTSTSYLYEMMVVSFLNFQADEFMEAVAGKYFKHDTDGLRHLINQICFGEPVAVEAPVEVYGPLFLFVSRLLRHPSVMGASVWDQERLKQELDTYLKAHVTQIEDNARFEQNGPAATQTFSRWVQTTSADHTSCPYAFAFVSCLLSTGYGTSNNKGSECFPTASQKYFAERWCRHLAIMCRMYNDVGSVARDAAEGNLNSVDFPEFKAKNGRLMSAVEDLQSKKVELLRLAEFERGCLFEAERQLEKEILKEPLEANKAKLAVWSVFRDVTDLHGQIYLVRDIASRMRPVVSSNGENGGRV